MKWVLIWFATGTNFYGAASDMRPLSSVSTPLASGHVPFASLEACQKAKDVPNAIMKRISSELTNASKPDGLGFARTVCVNTETGEWKENQ